MDKNLIKFIACDDLYIIENEKNGDKKYSCKDSRA